MLARGREGGAAKEAACDAAAPGPASTQPTPTAGAGASGAEVEYLRARVALLEAELAGGGAPASSGMPAACMPTNGTGGAFAPAAPDSLAPTAALEEVRGRMAAMEGALARMLAGQRAEAALDCRPARPSSSARRAHFPAVQVDPLSREAAGWGLNSAAAAVVSPASLAWLPPGVLSAGPLCEAQEEASGSWEGAPLLHPPSPLRPFRHQSGDDGHISSSSSSQEIAEAGRDGGGGVPARGSGISVSGPRAAFAAGLSKPFFRGSNNLLEKIKVILNVFLTFIGPQHPLPFLLLLLIILQPSISGHLGAHSTLSLPRDPQLAAEESQSLTFRKRRRKGVRDTLGMGCGACPPPSSSKHTSPSLPPCITSDASSTPSHRASPPAAGSRAAPVGRHRCDPCRPHRRHLHSKETQQHHAKGCTPLPLSP